MYSFVPRCFLLAVSIFFLGASAFAEELASEQPSALIDFGDDAQTDVEDFQTVDRLPEWLYFFTRANGINYGILFTQLAVLQKELGGQDYVREGKMFTLIASFLYGFGKLTDLAITDRAAYDNGDPSLASVITAMRLGTYSLDSMQFGVSSWVPDIADPDALKAIPGALQLASMFNSITGIPIAYYDLHGKVNALYALELPENPSEAELALYEKAWGGVYAYGIKMLGALTNLGVNAVLFAGPIENQAYNKATKWTLWGLSIGGAMTFLYYEQGKP